jgi:hypothetical protein
MGRYDVELRIVQQCVDGGLVCADAGQQARRMPVAR